MDIVPNVDQINPNTQLYHGITFKKLDKNGKYNSSEANNKHTWTHFNLIPSSRPVIEQPQISKKYVEIPGKHGSLDLSDYLTGKPVYSDREGTLEFYVINPNPQSWEQKRSDIAMFFDGSKMHAILDDDPTYCYVGRVLFRPWRSEAKNSKITLEYRFEPFKYKYSVNPSDPTIINLTEGAL